MTRPSNCERHERLGLKYLVALDLGDLDTLADLWELAVSDPELEIIFSALGEGFLGEVSGTCDIGGDVDIEISIGPEGAPRRPLPSLPRVQVKPPSDLSVSRQSLNPDASVQARRPK